ncbi:sensor histidine kinase [Oceanobacter kriegii]|uniref:sensor histidine kinase n=1 Tax=Oceanobacter kriegii TaxID=64972 RepID=UPI0004276BCB|nr:ATP-binding protein [Oceanobacter kriegii]
MPKTLLFAVALALGVCVLVLLSLVGYVAGIEALYRPLADGVATHPLTALTLLGCGVAVLLECVPVARPSVSDGHSLSLAAARGLAFAALLVALVRLLEDVSGTVILHAITPFQQLVDEELAAGKSNAMGANTAITMMLLAASLLMRSFGHARMSQLGAFGSLFFPVTSLAGYSYGLQDFYGEMSPITCLLTLWMGVSCLFLTADSWVMNVLLGNTSVSRVGQIQLVASLSFPLFVGYGVLFVQTREVSSLFAIVMVAFMWFSVTLISYSMLRLRRFEDDLKSSIQQLGVSESQFRDLFEYSPIATLLLDKKNRVVSSNHEAEKLFDTPRDELHNMSVDSLVPDGKAFIRDTAPIEQQAESDSGYDLDSGNNQTNSHESQQRLVATARSGTQIPVEVSHTPIATLDGQQTLLAISDRTEVQHHLDSLERSNKELDQFAYIASHDLRAPLRAITSLTRFIEEDLGDQLQGETAEHFSLLKGRVKRMDMLLNDLLEYSRVGRTASRPEWLDLDDVIDGLRQLYLPDNRFTIEVLGNTRKVFAARPQFELVARNLLMNSVKHHHLDAGHIRVWVEPADDTTCVYFADDGPGIEPRFRQKVFDIFTTLKPRDEVEGSGMGLALVAKSMQLVGGTVEVVDKLCPFSMVSQAESVHNGADSQEKTAQSGTTFCLQYPNHVPV